MKLFNPDKSTLMEVTLLGRGPDGIVIKGSILGSMPITCILTPAQARSALKLIKPSMYFYVFTFLFRR